MIRQTRAVLFLLVMLTAAVTGPARAAANAPFTAHYVSQRVDKAYLREGPSYDHKVLWVYRHRGYPFRVLASFDVWRRVKAADGTLGWMSASMLTDRRTVIVTGQGRARVFAKDDPTAKLAGLADPGAIAFLKACTRDYCRIDSGPVDGWISKARIWGADPQEVFK